MREEVMELRVKVGRKAGRRGRGPALRQAEWHEAQRVSQGLGSCALVTLSWHPQPADACVAAHTVYCVLARPRACPVSLSLARLRACAGVGAPPRSHGKTRPNV
jgi:hypothetical protein